ncbi:MAG TPA: NAD(P)H-dependent oxidoreductase [Polyangiaceae bacterium]
MPRPIALIYAHPYPDRSHAGKTLLAGVRDLPDVDVRQLYSLYPDFDIDVEVEQEALLRADIVVWQCPTYWYGLPALLHLWIEKVLAHGWAYGAGGDSVRGKTSQWVTTTGAPISAYRPGEMHGHPFEAFVYPVSQTARFCGMHWEPPLVIHGSHRISEAELDEATGRYRHLLQTLAVRGEGDGVHG